jgi:hypothetical protein
MPRSAKASSTSAERERTPVALRQALPLLQRHKGLQRARRQVKAATADAQPAVWPDPPAQQAGIGQEQAPRGGGAGPAAVPAAAVPAAPLLCLQRRRQPPHRPCPRTAGRPALSDNGCTVGAAPCVAGLSSPWPASCAPAPLPRPSRTAHAAWPAPLPACTAAPLAGRRRSSRAGGWAGVTAGRGGGDGEALVRPIRQVCSASSTLPFSLPKDARSASMSLRRAAASRCASRRAPSRRSESCSAPPRRATSSSHLAVSASRLAVSASRRWASSRRAASSSRRAASSRVAASRLAASSLALQRALLGSARPCDQRQLAHELQLAPGGARHMCLTVWDTTEN